MTLYTRGAKLYIDFNVGGKRVRKATGLEDTPKNRDYVSKNASAFTTIAPSAKAKRSKAKGKSPIMLSNIIASILQEAKGLKQGTQIAYQSRLNTIKNALCGERSDLPISAISREHIARFHELCIHKDYTKTQIKSLLQVLKRIFTHALELGAIEKSPLYRQKFTTARPGAEPKPLSLNEVERLLQSCPDRLFKTYLATAFFTGARCGELYALMWEHIDFDKDEIHITQSYSQNGTLQSPKTQSSSRTIDMLPIVKKALLKLLESKGLSPKDARGFIFTQNPSKDIKAYRQKWHKILAQNALDDRVLYNTRHSFASIMLNNGENALWVGCKMMGHKDGGITYKAYARFLAGEKSQRALFLQNKEDLI